MEASVLLVTLYLLAAWTWASSTKGCVSAMISVAISSKSPDTIWAFPTDPLRRVPSVLRLVAAQSNVSPMAVLARSNSASKRSPGGGAVGLLTCQFVKEYCRTGSTGWGATSSPAEPDGMGFEPLGEGSERS